MSKDKDTLSLCDIHRRKFLQCIGFGSAIVVTTPVSGQLNIKLKPRDIVAVEKQPIRPDILKKPYETIRMLRSEDLLSLELRYHGFQRKGDRLHRVKDAAHLVVIFQPQAITEQAWAETQGGLETPVIPSRLFIGGESRLVFKIPSGMTTIPIEAGSLLRWDDYELVVNPRAKHETINPAARLGVKRKRFLNVESGVSQPHIGFNPYGLKGLTKTERRSLQFEEQKDGSTMSRREAIRAVRPGIGTVIADQRVRAPLDLETAIEVPNRLYLSPTKTAAWKHRVSLSEDPGLILETNRLFELWHTRLAEKTSHGIDDSDITLARRILRAIWADDANPEWQEPPVAKPDALLGTTSMKNVDRHCIVHESSNFLIKDYTPPPIRARRLFLSTLGAWLDSSFKVERDALENARANARANEGIIKYLNLLKWQHLQTLGREHYVEIVKAGFIFPFGHEAVHVTITERKPHRGTRTAANFQRQFVVITEPIKYYDPVDGAGRFMNTCFSAVEFVTTVSPLLDEKKIPIIQEKWARKVPQFKLGGESPDPMHFVIKSLDKPVSFVARATDLEGNSVDFSTQLVFVSTTFLANDSNLTNLVDAYNQPVPLGIENHVELGGQSVALASCDNHSATTTFASYRLLFNAQEYKEPDESQGFLPKVAELAISEPSFQRLTGKPISIAVELVDDRNDGHVFAKVKYPAKVDFSGQSDKTGGLASPNFQLTGLSKATGAFGGDLDQTINAAPQANSFFGVSGMPEPTLFGVFKLSELLNFGDDVLDAYDISKPLKDRDSRIPNLQSRETSTHWITSYRIKPEVNALPGSIVAFKTFGETVFEIETEVLIPKQKDSDQPTFTTDAFVKNFDVSLVQVGADYLISLHFKEVRFFVEAGRKADVSVSMGDMPISFGGPLSFINSFTQLIDPEGFYDPPYVDVSMSGIKCGYTLSLPNLQMGAFTLSHLALGAEVNLPFSGAPLTVGFRFCERQQPFTLTISCFGGGGFFGLELDLKGLRQIEAALEFGAAVSLNFGVASGGVSVMAGIYFKMVFDSPMNSTQLTGYVRINGAVSVLGLITASIELYMALTYLLDQDKAFGEASLKIKVEVLFISKTVTIRTQRTFAGSGKDPNFQMAITQDDWLEYCAAFAA